MKNEYYFDILYRSGHENVVADALSRNPIDDVKVTLAIVKVAGSARSRQISVFPTVTRRAARENKQHENQRSMSSSSMSDAKLITEQKRAVEQPVETKDQRSIPSSEKVDAKPVAEQKFAIEQPAEGKSGGEQSVPTAPPSFR